jgi:predicted kinase
MTLVVMLCGLTGSGKTTYARGLEAQGFTRLSVDEVVFEANGRYGVDYPESEYFDRGRLAVAAVKRQLLGLMNAGEPVVLDIGLWRKADRDAYKRLIKDHGGTWRLLYFRADRQTLMDRLRERNLRADANALTVTSSALDDFIRRFEPPAGEGEEIIDV